MADGRTATHFLVKLVAILVICGYPRESLGICRYGYYNWCAFQCFCTTSCDQETGECLNGGQCVTDASGVQNSGDGCLTGNVAYYKDAYQIGTWGPHVASRAVDGNTNPDLNAGHCAHPDSGDSNSPAWWYVDLRENHRIYSVTIYNRVADDGISHERLADFSIRVGDSTDVTQNPSCATFSGPAGSGESVTLACETTGQYVGLLRDNDARIDKHLATICEMVVIGHQVIECSDCPTTCQDDTGCEKCTNGTRLPDCKMACADGRWGENCEQQCPSACLSGTVCDKETGDCNGGCGAFEKSNPWRFGDKCEDELPNMSFGSTDIIHKPPIVTSTSVTWEWTESRADAITSATAQYVGYYLWYRKSTDSEWSKTSGLSYQQGSTKQQGTVGNLESGTRYEFDISVYRTYDGQIYEDSFRARSLTLMDATTDPSNSPTLTTTSTTTAATTTTTTTTTTKPPTVGSSAPTASISSTIKQGSNVPPQSTTTISTTTKVADPSSSNSTGERRGNKGAVIGGAVAAAIVVVAAVAVLVIFLLRRKGVLGSSKPASKQPLTKPKPEITIIDGAPMTGNGTSASNGFVNTAFESELGDKPMMNENIYENTPALQPLNTVIKVEELSSYVAAKGNTPDGFKMEFTSIRSGELRECNIGSSPENKSKNRFGNIKAYDATRVILDIEDPDRETDYVNANYITGYKDKEKVYVATQAPKPHTIQDLWRMIWQLNSNRIVMVTQVVETGRKKSEYYWSEDVGVAQTHGDFSVIMHSHETCTDYAVRIFHVTKGDETRTIRHLQFLLWPDKRAPEHSFPLLNYRRKVRSFDSVSTGPMVVHCSAGVGRTGTFIALDYLLKQAEEEGEVDIVKLVNQLRNERTTMIQTLPQYVFVYQSLLEALTCGKTAIPCGSLQSELDRLLSSEGGTATAMEAQFNILCSMKAPKPSGKLDGLKEENMAKNRFNHMIPARSRSFNTIRNTPLCQNTNGGLHRSNSHRYYDHHRNVNYQYRNANLTNNYRPCLSTKWDGHNDYINAVMIDSFKTSNSLIATQHPLEKTVIDFWRLVYDHRCDTVIMLNTLDKNDEFEPFQQCVEYWPSGEEAQMYGPLEVSLKTTDATTSTTVREFDVSKGNSDNPLNIRQFQIHEWPNDEQVPSTSTMLDLIDKVSTWREEGHKGRVIIHCVDGASRSGIYCAANYMLEKMKNDNEVDVFLAVRYVALRRPEFVDNEEQYTFLHQLALDYMSRYDQDHTYANM